MPANDQRYIDASARQLREARLTSGLSLRELARRARTSHATLLAYESGQKVPAISTWLRIMDAAGLAVDLVSSRRVRIQDGVERGEELAAVLKLAEQFPNNASRHLTYPPFKQLYGSG